MTPSEAASHWFVRQDAGRMTADDRREFQRWLDVSEVNRRAYEKTAALWSDFEQAADVGELRALRVAALATVPTQRIWPRAAAMAAGVLGALGLGVFVLNSQVGRQPAQAAVAAAANVATHYETARNQRSTVTLPDGTVVSMNLNTALETDFSAGRRNVHLKGGQAFFDVAKDRARPFVVTAADRRIEALGTQFDVRVEPDRVEVVLVEGRVAVDGGKASILGALLPRAAPVELAPGQRWVAATGQSPAISATNATQATSWREGWVVFENESVERAIVELNRYSERPIVAGDEAVKRLRVSGVFRIGQSDRFADVIQELLPIEVERSADGETVLRTKP